MNLVLNSADAQTSLTTRLTQYKITVDDSITSKTAAQSINPTNVGNRYKDLANIVKSVVDTVRHGMSLQSVTDIGSNTTNPITIGDQSGRYTFLGQYSLAGFNGNNGNFTSLEFEVPTGQSQLLIPDIANNVGWHVALLESTSLQNVTDVNATTTNQIKVTDGTHSTLTGPTSIVFMNESGGDNITFQWVGNTGSGQITMPDVGNNSYTMAIAETETCDAVFARGSAHSPLVVSAGTDSTSYDNGVINLAGGLGDMQIKFNYNQPSEVISFPDPFSDAGIQSVTTAYKESETPDNIFQRGSAAQTLNFDNGFNSKVKISPLGAYFSGGGGPTNFAHLSSPVLAGNIDVVLPDHSSTIAALDQTGLDSVTARQPYTPFNFGYNDGFSKVTIDGSVKVWDLPHNGIAASMTTYTFTGNTFGGMYFTQNGDFNKRINVFPEVLTANRGQVMPDADGYFLIGSHGTATFSSGVVTVSDTRIKSTSVVTIVYDCSSCGAIGAGYKATYSAGTGFTLTSLKSTGATETSDNNPIRYTITY